MRACEVDPFETDRWSRVYAGARASPKSRPSSTAGPSRRPSTACHRGRRARPGGRQARAMDLRHRRALGLLGALAWLAAGPLLAAGPAAAAAGWRWPLDPPVAVVAEFAAPAGPFAPGHRGVDLGGQVGDPVRSAGAGVVAFAGVVAGRGVVSVDHPGGLRTSYEPVTATVARGDQVGAGAVLGRLEAVASHCPPAACLHWGLRRGETYLDPRSLLGAVRVRLLPVWGSTGPAALPAAVPVGRVRVAEAGTTTGVRDARWRQRERGSSAGRRRCRSRRRRRQPCCSAGGERRPRAGRAGRRPAGGSRPGRCRRGRRAGRSRGRRSC